MTAVVLSPKSEFFKYFGQAPGGGKTLRPSLASKPSLIFFTAAQL
jgi:hypothetical protein